MILGSGILSLLQSKSFLEEYMKLGFSAVYNMFVTRAEELIVNLLDAYGEKVGSMYPAPEIHLSCYFTHLFFI